MYPFSVETYEGTFRSINLLDYDYWRLDTASLQADWYIDPNMKDGPIRYMRDKKYFVLCFIPKIIFFIQINLLYLIIQKIKLHSF